MKKRLSGIIGQAQQPETYLSDQEVMSLLGSGTRVAIPKAKSYRPKRILRMSNALKIIIMTSIIVIITSALLIWNPGIRDLSKNSTEKSSIKSTALTNSSAVAKSVTTVPTQEESFLVSEQSGELVSKLPGKKINTSTEKSGGVEKSQIAPELPPQGNKALVWYQGTILKINHQIMECLGFFKTPDGYELPTKGKDGWKCISFNTKVRGIGVGPSTAQNHPDDSPIFLAATCLQGSAKWSSKIFEEIPFWMDDHEQAFLEICIPISIDDLEFDSLFFNPVIWVYPNERFFQCLPPEIAGSMKKEFTALLGRFDKSFVPLLSGNKGIQEGNPIKDTTGMGDITATGNIINKESVEEKTEPVPCVYFPNLCTSLPGLDYLNLYPNPVTKMLSVDLVLQSAKKIQFSVFDLNGRMLDVADKTENYLEGGQYKHQIDVSRLLSGLYLLVMTDEEGARLTRRFVKN